MLHFQDQGMISWITTLGIQKASYFGESNWCSGKNTRLEVERAGAMLVSAILMQGPEASDSFRLFQLVFSGRR